MGMKGKRAEMLKLVLGYKEGSLRRCVRGRG
jgi:hypothetical protein